MFKVVSQTFLHKQNKKFLTSHLPPHKSFFLHTSDTEFYGDPSSPSPRGDCITGLKIFLTSLQLSPFSVITAMPLLPWTKEQNLPLNLCISKYFLPLWTVWFLSPYSAVSIVWLFPISLRRSRWPGRESPSWWPFYILYFSINPPPPLFCFQSTFSEKILNLTVSSRPLPLPPEPHCLKVSWQEWLSSWVIVGVRFISGLAIFAFPLDSGKLRAPDFPLPCSVSSQYLCYEEWL